jgi:hypothetical protein
VSPEEFVAEVESGDRLRALEALRRELARAITQAVDGKELAALALRLQRVLAEIHELGGTANEEEADDLAARRDAKLRAAAGT